MNELLLITTHPPSAAAKQHQPKKKHAAIMHIGVQQVAIEKKTISATAQPAILFALYLNKGISMVSAKLTDHFDHQPSPFVTEIHYRMQTLILQSQIVKEQFYCSYLGQCVQQYYGFSK
jgi:hypothetical protein